MEGMNGIHMLGLLLLCLLFLAIGRLWRRFEITELENELARMRTARSTLLDRMQGRERAA